MNRRIAVAALLLAACTALCEEPGWPHWRGPGRDGRTPVALAPKGVKPTLRERWKADVREGCGSVVIGDGRLYAVGWRNGQEHVTCLDAADGNTLWTHSYRAPRYGRHARGDQGFYSGPSATPELDGDAGLLFTLGIDGELACWDVRRDGKPLWRFNLHERFKIGPRPDAGGGQRDYGFATAPLVVGDFLLVMVGGADGCIEALDKHTGEQAWTSRNRDPAGHAGGMSPMTVRGVPCIAALTLKRLLIVRTEGPGAGETVAEYPWQTQFANNIVTPTPVGGRLLLSSDYNLQKLVLLDVKGTRLEPAWESRQYSGVASPVAVDGRVYLAQRRVRCLDMATGNLLWSASRCGSDGSCVATGDGYLVVYGDGALSVLSTAERLGADKREVARVGGLCRKDQAWPHVAVTPRRVYCRDRTGSLRCFDTSPAD